MQDQQDTLIDQWADNLKPQVKEALKLLLGGASVVSFQVGEVSAHAPNGSEIKTPLFAFFAPEMHAKILQGCANGIMEAGERQKQIQEQLQMRIVTQ